MRSSETTTTRTARVGTSRVIEQLDHLELCQNYVRAFEEVIQLPLVLISPQGIRAAVEEGHHKNPLCKWLALHHHTCRNCLYSRPATLLAEENSPSTEICFAGISQSGVPVRIGNITLGFLRTGGVATQHPTRMRFSKMVARLKAQGIDFDEHQLCQIYFSTPTMSEEHYRSVLDLLTIFAAHLSLLAGQLVLRNGNSESATIQRARAYIKEHFTEPLTLQEVADCAHLSACYFCKKFKQSTGLSFTEYIARTRVEAAKNLLIQPRIRVSEVAFAVGFQSLTHFNRVFKGIAGQSPTDYRRKLPGVTPPA